MFFFPSFHLHFSSFFFSDNSLADVCLAFCQIENHNRLRRLLGLGNGHMRVQVHKRLRPLVRLKLVRLLVHLPNVSPSSLPQNTCTNKAN